MGTKRRKNSLYGHKIEEKELKKLYDKYVKNRSFYRVVSNEYLPKILPRERRPPKNNRFKPQKTDTVIYKYHFK